jgi:hypothetical protein
LHARAANGVFGGIIDCGEFFILDKEPRWQESRSLSIGNESFFVISDSQGNSRVWQRFMAAWRTRVNQRKNTDKKQ